MLKRLLLQATIGVLQRLKKLLKRLSELVIRAHIYVHCAEQHLENSLEQL